MFSGCKNFNLNLNNWDVSIVTDMRYMFKGCINFNGDISNWNVSKVYNMNSMFKGCINFNQPLDEWNVSNVRFMDEMFKECINFNRDISNWDVSKVISMKDMFKDCQNFNQDLSSWNIKLPLSINIDDMGIDSTSCANNNCGILVRPTIIPTVRPTIIPTVRPTVRPTIRPTIIPTVSPTVRPTIRPTPGPTLECTTHDDCNFSVFRNYCSTKNRCRPCLERVPNPTTMRFEYTNLCDLSLRGWAEWKKPIDGNCFLKCTPCENSEQCGNGKYCRQHIRHKELDENDRMGLFTPECADCSLCGTFFSNNYEIIGTPNTCNKVCS